MTDPLRAQPAIDPPPPTRLKLSTLWASLTPRDLHGDHFGLYKPGTLAHAHARPAA